MLILDVLGSGDKYGYELTQMINDLSEGILNIKEGSLYPSLYKLEEKGYISEEKRLVGKRRTRVYYHIEDTGREHLKELINDYKRNTKGIMMVLDAKK